MDTPSHRTGGASATRREAVAVLLIALVCCCFFWRAVTLRGVFFHYDHAVQNYPYREFFAEGPVRFAPAVYDGKVYVGSDDGYVYCIDGEDGSLVWKYRAGPSDEKVVGNGKLRLVDPMPMRYPLFIARPDGGELIVEVHNHGP